MRGLGLVFMIAALAMLMAMVVGTIAPGLILSMLSYGFLFVGVFCFTAGVIRQR